MRSSKETQRRCTSFQPVDRCVEVDEVSLAAPISGTASCHALGPFVPQGLTISSDRLTPHVE
jgi:hypothetical protein